MLPATVRLFFAVEVLCLLVYWELCLGVNARAYHKRDLKRHNETSHGQRDRTYTQKKPRSAQYGFVPQYQPVYSRQNIPVRLASVPASPLRVPVTGIRRLSNVGSFPALQRAYIPVVASLPGVQYPTVLQQNGVGGRYVIPYGLNMPSSRASSAGSESQMFDKHYNEKYNTLPTVSNADMDQDAPSLRRKLEDKKLDLGDDFDHFLDSLDGPCSKNPCKNGAKCRISHEGSSFFCICKKGFKGKTCEDKNPCFPNPCDNDGQCTLTSEGFECSCPKGFKGKKCEQENKCEPNPCENGGFCNELKNGEFECTCKRGFFGEKCQVTKKGCEPNPCLNEGRCSEQDDGSYKCTCMEGYTGRTCERSENKCLVNPCKNGGSCLPAMTSLGYECSCLHGFRGPNCEDHTGCDLNSCQNGGTCYETEFGVRCICKNGYSGDKCQVRKFCEADTCQNNGRCIEHANGFRCMCSEGYKGKTCEEMDRCRPNPCLHGGECVQSDSGYLCKCTSQYQGENCEVQNPCFENPCKNGGKCLGGLTGEYQCQCSDGYLGKNCEERNACQPNPCENSGVCRRNGDDFICECEEGYRGKRCEDNDPCRINPCQNGGSCQRNGDNDYTCSCPEDFKGLHCEARKPCHPNPCLNDGTCEENDGDFTCSCKRGFRGKNCEELDRCEPSPCKNGGRCTPLSNSNTGKGFTCECINSFYGDTCEERNPCNPNPCANNGLCADVNGGFTCQCTAGFKGDRCHEIDKCAPNPCKHSGTCTEVIGGLGYACRCAYGYKGQDCEQKDHCHPNPCDHDGQCVPLDNELGFKCKCSYGFRGQRCSDVNPCEPNPCHHEGQCIALPGFGPSHICNCSTGWSGETCQKREICQPNPCQYGTKCVETGDDSYSCVKSMCHPNPCQNSGKCINVNEDDYQCACTDDYEGRRCEVPRHRSSQLSQVPNPPVNIYSRPSAISNRIPNPRTQLVTSSSQVTTAANAFVKSGRPPTIPMTAIASCSPFLCQNGGVCVQEEGKPIRCKCKASFTGETCEINKCTKNPCRNGGMCLAVEREPGFVCKCRDGLTGPLCSRKQCEPNPCKNGGDCVMFYSVYLCKCKPGFEGKHCESSLSPKTAEVETEAKAKAQTSLDTKTNPGNRVSACYPSPCENGARCVESTDGEFQCICSQDFSGPRCEDKGIYKYSSAPKFFPGENEECKHCDKNARCVNGHCICRNKYVGDGLECWKQTQRDKEWSCDRNPCQNGGTCKPGIARCVCRLGYVGDYCEEYSPPVVRLTFDKLVEGNKLLDDSGNENDAVVLNGFQIAPKQGKCDNAGNLLGGDILFDGQNFKGIPRRAITIAAWVKVSTPLGIQSIFDTIGSHSEHRDGQYHFEIDNGRVRWFHRNEQGKTVFSVVTDQPVVNGSNWVLVTGTYSSKKNRARIFVNGDMIKEEKAHGMLLSGDWGAKAGIGKHKHRYGARVLRGMVDEFSIFPSELSRLQILVLMKHCKVYYKRFTQSSKTTSTNQFQESFTEMKSYTPAAGDTSQSAVPYTPSYYQDTSSQRLPTTKWQYQGYTSASPRPLESTNHPSVNYQPASNTRTPVQTYSHSGYYGNTIKQNYQANTGQYQQASIGGARQTGYQRTQTLRQPYVSPHTPGLSSTIGPTPPRNKRPKIINGPFVPKYLHEAPSTATQEGYQRTPLAPAVSTYDPGPSYRAMPAQVGYITTQTPRGPIMNQNVPLVPQTRNQEQMGTVRTQAPRVPTITPSVPATYEYPSVRNLYQSQAKPNTSPYNAYTALPGQQPSANYQTAQSSWAVPDNGQRDVTSFGTASQARGNINNVQNTPQVAPPPYQTARTSATGTRYSTIPQTDSGVQYRTAQNVGTNWGGQYQSISSTGSEFASQYGPVQTLDNTPSYQPEAKGYIPGNNYQSRFEKPWQQNTDQITSANADVRSTSYTNSWPGRTQNGYTTSNVYSNQVNNYQNDANKRYRPASYFNANNLDSASPSLQSGVSGIGFPSSSYTTSSTSAYGASMNSYPTPSNMNFYNGARRQKIPKPLSQSAKKTLQSKPVYSQSLPAKVGNKQGQLNGPTYKNNNKQYNPASSKQLDNNGQYPSDVRQYQNNILKSSVQAKSSTATPDRPLTTTSGTTGANIGSPTPTVQQTGYTRDRSGWWTGTRTQAATGQWDANVVPSAKQMSTIGWSKKWSTKNSKERYPPTMVTVNGLARMPNSRQSQNQNLAQTLAMEKPQWSNGLSQDQKLATNLAVDAPNVYKRTMITMERKHG